LQDLITIKDNALTIVTKRPHQHISFQIWQKWC